MESNRLFTDCYTTDRTGAHKFIASSDRGIMVMKKVDDFPKSAWESRQLRQPVQMGEAVEELVAVVIADLSRSDEKMNLVWHMHESLHRISKERLIYGGNYSEWHVTEKHVKRRERLEGKSNSYHVHRDQSDHHHHDEKLPPIGTSVHADIMYVENRTGRRSPVYVSTEKTASFGYVESIDDKLAKTLLECISKNVGLFQSYGHRVVIEKQILELRKVPC